MTEEIKCKYKFQNKEKFDGEEFCTLFLEKCKFLEEAGICDYNCQVYEDYKQLQRLKQENRELREMLSKEPKAMQAFQIAYSGARKENETLWGMVKDYKKALEEIKIIADDTFQVCDDDCGNARKIKLIIDKINEVLS